MTHARLEHVRVQASQETDWRSGGPILADADLARVLGHRRGSQPAYQPSDNLQGGASLAGEIAYAGPITPHFGHFISECVHRILPARRYFGADRFLFVAPRGSGLHFRKLQAHARQILELLGLDEHNCVITDRDVIVEKLLVVEQGSTLGQAAHPAYLRILRDEMTARLDALHGRPAPLDRVYVCGRRGPGGGILGQGYFEAIMQQAGFLLFRPEEHAYSHQLHVYRSARKLIFSEGSAIHGTSLLGAGMLNDVTVMIRRPDFPYLVERFRADLAGRSERSGFVFCCRYLGSLVRRGTDALNQHGISCYNPTSLKQIFLENDIEKQVSFDIEEYYAECDRDFMAYLKFALGFPENECTPRDISGVTSRLALARSSDLA